MLWTIVIIVILVALFWFLNLKKGWVPFLQFGMSRKKVYLLSTFERHKEMLGRLPSRVSESGLRLTANNLTKVSDLLIEAVERGMKETWDRAKYHGWNIVWKDGKPTEQRYDSGFSFREYQIMFLPSELSPIEKKPGFRVPITKTSPYAGDPDYDKGGYILAGGEYHGTATVDYIMLPEPIEGYSIVPIEAGAQHETEHAMQSRYRPADFVRDARNKHSHPLIAPIPVTGLAFSTESEPSCTVQATGKNCIIAVR